MEERCAEVREQIPDFVTGSLPTEKTIAVSHHVGQCPSCREYLLGFEADDKLLGAFVGVMGSSVERVEQGVLRLLWRSRLDRLIEAISGRPVVRTDKAVKAAAAVTILVLVGVIIGIVSSSGRRIRQPAAKPQFEQLIQKPPATEPQQRPMRVQIEAELAELERMYTSGDLDGLIGMLSKASPYGKVFAAGYIGKIGDLRAVPPLARAAVRAGWAEPDNPFTAAIEEIIARYKARSQVAEEKTAPPPARTQPQIREKQAAIVYKGIVTDLQGQPVGAAIVRTDAGTTAQPDQQTGAAAKTQSDGSFRIEVPAADQTGRQPAFLVFEHPDYAIGWLRVSQPAQPDPNNLQVTLFRPAVVAGVVRDGYGNPIERAVVEAHLQIPSGKAYSYFDFSTENELAKTTGSNGWFFFDRVPQPARLHIDATRDGFARYSSRWHHSPAELYPIIAGQQDIEITLVPGCTVAGQLSLQDKALGKDGVKIFLTGRNGSFTTCTDALGGFEIPGVAEGEYLLSADNEQLAVQGLVCPGPIELAVKADAEKTVVALAVQKAVVLALRVVDAEDKQPVAETVLRVTVKRKAGLPVWSGKTDSEGGCKLALAAGEYTAWVPQGTVGGYLAAQDFSVAVGQKQVTLELPIAPGQTVSGRLVDAAGEPVGGLVILPGQEPVETDQEGWFAVPGRQGVASAAIGYAIDKDHRMGRWFFSQPTKHSEGLTVRLEPLATISGRIVDETGRGQPQADVRIKVSIPDGKGTWDRPPAGPSQMTADAAGWFSFQNIPAGQPVRLWAYKAGSAAVVTIQEPSAGQAIELSDVVLKAQPAPGTVESIDANDAGSYWQILPPEPNSGQKIVLGEAAEQ
jgi:hypothetical protein